MTPITWEHMSITCKRVVSVALLFLDHLLKKNVRFTILIQQLYNNPSHEGGSHILGPTLI
jgi:hypothetical protein